jgi:hypothetical protein
VGIRLYQGVKGGGRYMLCWMVGWSWTQNFGGWETGILGNGIIRSKQRMILIYWRNKWIPWKDSTSCKAIPKAIATRLSEEFQVPVKKHLLKLCLNFAHSCQLHQWTFGTHSTTSFFFSLKMLMITTDRCFMSRTLEGGHSHLRNPKNRGSGN